MSRSVVTASDHRGVPVRREIRINGVNPTFHLRTDDIEAQFMEHLDDLSLDLLEIAAAVFYADTSFPRGGDTRNKFGERWYRDFDFELEVRNPELWSRPDINRALVDCIEFMTDDRARFNFYAKEDPEPAEPYFPFKAASEHFQADEVILFSGGLDSYAGALEALKTRHGNVLLVTHRSAPKAIPRQEGLGKALKRDFGARVLHVQVRATRAGGESRETTQRSRSFLFAALGYVTARMSGARKLSFYENGVVSHNLPITPQVVGTMASRTTHPQTLMKLQQLLDLVGDTPIPIENRFQWLTKTEVLEKIDDLGGAKSIPDTVSCTKLRSESADVHHCGSCSQCLDRRFAIMAAGLERFDNAKDYKVDVLIGAREGVRSKTMAIEWTRHACRLADLTITQFGERFISELTRIAAAFDDAPPVKVIERCFDLQRRHGLAVRKVIKRCVVREADSISRRDLDPTSLLGMFLMDAAGSLPDLEDGLTAIPGQMSEPEAEAESVEKAFPEIFPLRVAFYQDSKEDVIEVDQLGCIRRAPANVAHLLKPAFEDDLAEGLAPENHRYLLAADIARLGRIVAPNTVVQNIRRCRQELAELFEVVEGHPPDRNLLIENSRPKGYRLDPTIRIIRRDQMGVASKP